MTVEVKNPRLDALEKRLERIESMLGAASWERVGRGTLPSCDRCRDSIRTEVDWDSQALRERLRDMKVVSGPFSRLLLDPDGGALRQQWYAYVEKVES